MPRLTPITKETVAAEQRAAAEGVLQVFGRIRGPFSMLLHSPGLAQQLLPLVTFCRDNNVVEPRLRFAAILAAVRENNAQYVWAAQVEQAHKNGIRDELIELLRTRGDASKLEPDEREVVEYVRQLVGGRRVDQATFDALKAKHDEKWLVELTAIVAFFGFVSTICNAFEVPIPEGGAKLNR